MVESRNGRSALSFNVTLADLIKILAILAALITSVVKITRDRDRLDARIQRLEERSMGLQPGAGGKP